MLSQEQSLESKISARDKRAADVFWWTSDGHAGGHSAICDLCNLSLLDFANCRSLFGRRLLTPAQP